MTNDVEKRWNDKAALRSAAIHVAASVGTAALAMALILVWTVARQDGCTTTEFAACTETERATLAVVPATILLCGGIWALIRAYRAWRNGRSWPIWQGAGWALLTLMTIYVIVSGPILVGH
jgi:hypothetical protein